ncbi:MAG: GNAT family N-acetyltransferase, partial [Verrucomicrobiae bacterium]|nr:GNAT family N-acetyltransferase [Verrucomicrobiae bacterium]
QQLTGQIRRGVDFRIAEIAGRPAGYVAWEVLPDGVTAHLHKLYLLPECHGQGFGQQMLQEVMAAAAARGCQRVELRVNKGNAPALRSYGRAGFETADSVVTDIGGGFVMDDYILRAPLTPASGAPGENLDTDFTDEHGEGNGSFCANP